MLLLTREDEKFAEGIAQGIRKANLATARRMREMGIDDSIIHQATNLSLEEIKNI